MKSLFTFVVIIILSLIMTLTSFGYQGKKAGRTFLPSDNSPQTIPFSQNWTNTGLISTSDDWSGVPGIAGYRGDNLTAATGVDPQTIVASGDSVIDVNANQTNPNTFTTGGVSEFDGIGDPVVALQGSGTADAPFILLHLNTTGKFGVNVAYNLRDIDGSTDNSIQPVALQYRVGSTGDFTNLPAGFVADASNGPSDATLVTPVSVLLPGAADNQAEVQVRIITSNAIGNDEWIGIDDINVTAGAVPTPTITVIGGPLSFGTAAVGTSSSEQTYTVSGADLTADISINAPAGFEVSTTTGSGFGSSVTLTQSGGSVSTTTIYARFTPVSSGPASGNITNASTGAVTQDVAVSGTGIPAGFTLSPSNVDFGSLLVGSTFTDTVYASNGDGTPVTVSSVTSTNADFSVAPTSGSVGALSTEPFAVSFSPSSPGIINGFIIFTHDGASSPDTVTVTGIGVDVGFSVNPSSINFGDLLVSEVAEDTVTVTNSGGVTLTITSVTSTSGEFSVNPTSATIGGSSSGQFVITFAPTTGGSKSGSIIFTHNGATSPDTVVVSGNAISIITIADARALPNASQVTIQGILTRSLGAFSRIQDSTAGLSIRQTVGAYFDSLTSGGLAEGDLVRITGRTSEFNGLKQINAADLLSFQRISRNNPLPAYQVVTLLDITNGGEQYESELILINDLSVVSGGDVNFVAAKTYQISDPSDLSNATTLRLSNAGDTNLDGLPILGTPAVFRGVLGQFSSANPAAGYQLLPVLAGDIDFSTGVGGIEPLPTVFALRGNYPNPFNPTTKIVFDVPAQANVSLVVYNILGEKIAELLNNELYQAGKHEVKFDASRFASGIYYYRLTAAEFSAVNKMMFIK